MKRCGCPGRARDEHDRPCRPAGPRYHLRALDGSLNTIDVIGGMVSGVYGTTAEAHAAVGDPWMRAKVNLERAGIAYEAGRWA